MQANEMAKNLESTLEKGQVEDMTGMGAFKNDKEMIELAMSSLGDQDLEVIRSSMTILYELAGAADKIQDM